METYKNISVTAWIYLALCLVTLLDALFPISFLLEISTALIFIFVAFEFRSVPRPQQIAGGILISLSLIAAAGSQDWQTVIVEGVGRSRIFLLLFFAISWLQAPAEESHSLGAVRANIVSQPPGRRFLYLAFGAHILGTVLNIAGLSLLTSIVEKQENMLLKRRLSVALMQGFTSASCWSPFYIGMIVVLVALPSLTWTDVAPAGALIALCIVLSGWGFDRIALRGSRVTSTKINLQAIGLRDAGRAIFILLSLVGLAMVAVELIDTNIPVALALIAPSYALIWYGSQNKRDEKRAYRCSKLARHVIRNLPRFRNESLVFVAANMFGVGIAAVLPSEDLSATLNVLVPSADAKLLLLIATFLVCSAVGLHPIIVVISVSAIFPPSALGLSDWIVALTFLGSWGISTMVSPFSGTTLFMSRVAGVQGHVIAWYWTPPTALLGATVVGGVVILLRQLVI